MLKRIIRKWRTRADASYLELLDDRLLNDIGLSRDQIHASVIGQVRLAKPDIAVRPTCATMLRDEKQAERGEGFARLRMAASIEGAPE